MTLPEQSCSRCGVPGPEHDDIMQCADAQIAYYAADTGRCSCGALEPCLAPRWGGRHVPPEVWVPYELGRRQ